MPPPCPWPWLVVQMLKFGQVINMDLLDKIGSSKGTEELKGELKKQVGQGGAGRGGAGHLQRAHLG